MRSGLFQPEPRCVPVLQAERRMGNFRSRSFSNCLTRWHVRAGLIGLVITVTAALTLAQPADPSAMEETDDRLPRDTQRLIEELTSRGMPELMEALVAKLPPQHRVHVARAAMQAALQTRDTAGREKLFAQAESAYRELLQLEKQTLFTKDERHRLLLAECRVEWADMILRHWIVPDLDRFEITSGLAFPKERLQNKLTQAVSIYQDARKILDDLMLGSKTEEERYLLLGITQRIARLAQRRDFNAAWAMVYLDQVGGIIGDKREDQLSAALQTFDATARQTGEASTRYNALLGSGLILRALKRYDEAESVFDKVADSTAPAELTVRARFEKVRMLTAAGRFESARKEAVALSAVPSKGRENKDSGADFYIRLAPLLRAHAYMVEADAPGADKTALHKAATDALNAVAEGGESWADLTQVYLDAIAGGPRGPDRKTAAELRGLARQQMAEKDYAAAESTLRMLLSKSGADVERERPAATFNLAICLYHLDKKREAAEQFVLASEMKDPVVARQAAESAMRCRRQIAKSSGEPRDYQTLAESAARFARLWPKDALADEASWIAGLAWEEFGDLTAAQLNYERVGTTSPFYWNARRNSAGCTLKLLDRLPPGSDAAARRAAGVTAAAAWTRLADRLSAADAPPYQPRDKRLEAIDDARLTAVEIMARPDVGEYDEGLRVLEILAPTPRSLALRIRCLRGQGDLKKAATALGEYMEAAPGSDVGAMLTSLAVEMEGQVDRLRSAGRLENARSMAEDTVSVLRQLLIWVEGRESRRGYGPAVRFSLAKTLLAAQQREEALRVLRDLMREAPDNGAYIRTAAQLHEQEAAGRSGILQANDADEAERLWAILLSDEGLRDRAPAEYWEARYHWLRHQLRHGHAADVVKGIETEKAYYPDLGGAPWQGRLNALHDEAAAAANTAPESP